MVWVPVPIVIAWLGRIVPRKGCHFIVNRVMPVVIGGRRSAGPSRDSEA